MNLRHVIGAAVLGCPLAAAPALAHTTIGAEGAPIGSTQKVVFRIGHGCNGSPTLKIRVQIPPGFVDAEPLPKAGWNAQTVTGKLDTPYRRAGKEVGEGIREIVWIGRLPDAQKDEFTISGMLSGDNLTPGTVLYFPFVQECENGIDRWIEIPAAGKSGDTLDMPAPGIKLLPKK